MVIYTGIGARKVPPDIFQNFISVGRFMAAWGHTLRSGAAEGSDSAFEMGCDSKDGTKEIYLPYRLFRKHESPLFGSTKEARMMAREFHPNWANLGWTGREFMARNAYQVMGLDLKTPTKFIICWTPDGKIVGGTGQALRMANYYEIPILNLGSMSLTDVDEAIEKLL